MGRPFLCSMYQREVCFGVRQAVGDAGPYGVLSHPFVGGGVPDAPPPMGRILPKPPRSQKFLLVIRGKVWYTAL